MHLAREATIWNLFFNKFIDTWVYICKKLFIQACGAMIKHTYSIFTMEQRSKSKCLSSR